MKAASTKSTQNGHKQSSHELMANGEPGHLQLGMQGENTEHHLHAH